MNGPFGNTWWVDRIISKVYYALGKYRVRDKGTIKDLSKTPKSK